MPRLLILVDCLTFGSFMFIRCYSWVTHVIFSNFMLHNACMPVGFLVFFL